MGICSGYKRGAEMAGKVAIAGVSFNISLDNCEAILYPH